MRPLRNVVSASILMLMCLIPSVGQAEQTCKDTIIATAPDSNYVIHDNGTVTDNTTGLVWMRCTLGQKWDGSSCSGTASKFSWVDALKAGDLSQFASYNDWRLPNKNELESIVEGRCFSPALNSRAFPVSPSDYFWSSSPYAGFSHGAWSVDFGYGTVNASAKTGKIYVRLVRGGE